jgi:hypothetical protein
VSAWPDALAFVAGLLLAWYGEWQTKDLVWSLWLSSLLVGYAMIVWDIFGKPVGLTPPDGVSVKFAAQVTVGSIVYGGRLILLAFFTVHFGMFHFVHSVFLNGFFPVMEGKHAWPSVALYLRVFSDYWPFVLVAAVAERNSFRAESRVAKGGGLMAPYRNVVRLHLLIFFFAFTHYAHVQSFVVYAVVYAVYFFPWRLLYPPKGRVVVPV